MVTTPIYLDNHATTRVDPRVLAAMLPYFEQDFGNAGSISHAFGANAKKAVDDARSRIAELIGATDRDIVFTSGATESNNLAIRGLAERPRRPGKHIISVQTEHRAVLDPLRRLARRGVEVTLLPVQQAPAPHAGLLLADQVAAALRDDTFLVSVMLANNEIGVVQPIADIAAVCQARGVPLHCDATQAVGKMPIDVDALQVDLMSFSAHKIYGPKGVGALYIRRRGGRLRLEPQIDGGGQEGGTRSGTLNVPGIVGFATALALCVQEMPQESERLRALRYRLWEGLKGVVSDIQLNGPDFNPPELRLPGNLNTAFPYVDGEALMISMRDVAVSSGSACTSADPEPSHVLRALGLHDDLVRASLRFGIGRFNTADEIDFTIRAVGESVRRLRQLSSAGSGN
jgi:cysteine desulfurase